MHTLINWLQTVTGLSNASGFWYLWWSGFFGDITIFVAGVAFYFHHQCTDNACHKWGRHTANGSPYCRKHHPNP